MVGCVGHTSKSWARCGIKTGGALGNGDTGNCKYCCDEVYL